MVEEDLDQFFEYFKLATSGELKNPELLLNQWEMFLIHWSQEKDSLSPEEQKRIFAKVEFLQAVILNSAKKVGADQGLSAEEFLDLINQPDSLPPEEWQKIQERKDAILKKSKEREQQERAKTGSQPKKSAKSGKKRPKRASRSKWMRS